MRQIVGPEKPTRTRLVRDILWGVVVGLAVVVIQVAAGAKPLAILIPALVTVALVALLLEFGVRWSLGRRLRDAIGAILARSPFIVSIRRRKPVELPMGQPGLWDFRRDGERAMSELTEILNEMAQAMRRSTKRTNRNTARMRRATSGNLTVERAYRLGERGAKAISDHAATMEHLEIRFRDQRVRMIENFTGWLRGQPSGADLTAWTQQLGEMATAAGQSLISMGQYRATVQGLRAQNISLPLNQATDRLDTVLNKIFESISATETWCRAESA